VLYWRHEEARVIGDGTALHEVRGYSGIGFWGTRIASPLFVPIRPACSCRATARASNRWLLDIASVFLISLAAVLSALCGYQSGRWGGYETQLYNEAKTYRVMAADAQGTANDLRLIDVGLFLRFVDAVHGHDVPMEQFLYQRFRPEGRPAIKAWIATKPVQNPSAPSSPFVMPHRLRTDAEARHDNALAASDFQQAREANRRFKDYLLLTVIFAGVSFLAGISTQMVFPRHLIPGQCRLRGSDLRFRAIDQPSVSVAISLFRRSPSRASLRRSAVGCIRMPPRRRRQLRTLPNRERPLDNRPALYLPRRCRATTTRRTRGPCNGDRHASVTTREHACEELEPSSTQESRCPHGLRFIRGDLSPRGSARASKKHVQRLSLLERRRTDAESSHRWYARRCVRSIGFASSCRADGN
jgi:hypothetical protein